MFDELMTMRCSIIKMKSGGYGDREIVSTTTLVPCFYEDGIFDKTMADGQKVTFSGCLYLKANAPLDINYTNYDFTITSPETIPGLQAHTINTDRDPNTGKIHHYEVWLK
jgi:hypothetical protein